ncbi:MAG: ATP-binding protein, partial [Spirochaetales bacterium]|nr:ATP-binding protein [Spirochaetales bacterium]
MEGTRAFMEACAGWLEKEAGKSPPGKVSLFYRRLKEEIRKEHENTPLKKELETLIRTVETVAGKASEISSHIVKILPHYTLHNETHFYNVLAFMEQLVPEPTLASMSALECALGIFAAFTHDLAMVISEEEKRKILGQGPHEGCEEHAKFQGFCMEQKQYGEAPVHLETRSAASAPEKQEDVKWRIDALRERLLGDYIRSTHSHTGRGYNCINTWLTAFEADEDISFTYHGLSYKSLLCLLDVSHGQAMNWIEKEMKRRNRTLSDVYEMSTADGPVNFAYVSWLLHLADLLDCDASHTPPVIYRHIGITDQVSKAHWEKHLSVDCINFCYNKEKEEFDLTFVSHSCPSPIIHKMILDHVKQVNAQITEIRTAMYTAPFDGKEKYLLNLPASACAEIKEERDDRDKEKYLYHDICFELDQDEIFQILMGQELYGEPELCLRELIQNSLDALQLRDLHSRIPRDKRFRPVNTIDIAAGETRHVEVDWGEDKETGELWISVSDNGTGMTREVIEQYFTQIGKSYYNSPGYRSDREKLKELLRQSRNPVKTSTPVSKFGIGILSCFMIADRIEVKTCPMMDGARDLHIHEDLLWPYDIIICGPGSLFWLKEGTRTTCGTKVTLFLKKEYRFFTEEKEPLIARLKYHFYGRGEKDKIPEIPAGSIHIPLEIYKTLIWPMYPIVFPGTLPVLDHRFHFDHLLSIDENKLKGKLREWGIPEKAAGTPGWAFIDWTDETTGSRVRLAMASSEGKEADLFAEREGEFLRQYEYNAFIEPQLPKKRRFFPMINSMHVDNWENFPLVTLLFFVHMGAVLWIDYRGRTTPGLKADRKGFTRKVTGGIEQILSDFYKKFLSSLIKMADDRNVIKKQLLTSINAPLLREKFSQGLEEPGVINLYSLINENMCPDIQKFDFNNKILLLKSFFYMDVSLPHILDLDLDLDLGLDLDLDLNLNLNLDLNLNLNLDLNLNL